jgi:hypothetical protein
VSLYVENAKKSWRNLQLNSYILILTIMEALAYSSIRENIRRFRRSTDYLKKAFTDDKEVYKDAFNALNTSISTFELYQEISSLGEMQKVKEALKIVSDLGSWGWKDKAKGASSLVLPTVDTILFGAEVAAKRLKPGKDQTKKEGLIQVIRKYRSWKEALAETARQHESLYGID